GIVEMDMGHLTGSGLWARSHRSRLPGAALSTVRVVRPFDQGAGVSEPICTRRFRQSSLERVRIVSMVQGRDLSTCRLFTGYLPGYRTCTTQVELDAAHRRLYLHLASVSRFSVALDHAAAGVLAATLAADGACAVPCRHERGDRLLGAHPHTEPGVVPYSERQFDPTQAGGPMSLYLYVGEAAAERITITFTR